MKFNELADPMEYRSERYIAINGMNIRYAVRGFGRPLLLLHGFCEFLETWDFNLRPLGERYRVYAIDLPGHGLSDKPYLDYNIAFFTDFTVSFMNDVSLLHKLCSVPVLAKTNRRGKRTALEERLNLEFYKPDFVAQEIVGRSYLFMRMPEARRVMLNIMHNWVDAQGLRREATMMDRLHLIQSPTLIIHCVQDRIHPLRLFRDAWRRIPDARIRILTGCGHCPHIEKAAEFNAAVIEFLETN